MRAGVQVRVLTTDADMEGRIRVSFRREEEGIDIRVFRLPWGTAKITNRYAFAPALALETWRSASWAHLCVFQGVYTFPLLLGPRLSRARRVPYVISARGTLEAISRSEKRWKKALYFRLVERSNIERAAAIRFSTEEEMRSSEEILGDTPRFVGANPMDFGDLAEPDPEGLRARLGLARDSLLVGVSGRLHPRKGFEVIVPALARSDPRLCLVSFGSDEGGYADRVRAIATGAGVSDRLRFLGQLSGKALQDAYASVDVLAVPSVGESFGNVVLEALAQGTEVLVSDRVPLKKYVERHGFGEVVPKLEPSAWATALDAWTRRRGVFDREAAARGVRRDFAIEVQVGQLLAEYVRIVGSRSNESREDGGGAIP